MSSLLLLGFGNPGRQDDGLGPALAAAIEELDLPGVQVDTDYQLTVEDAAELASHERVLLVDADMTGAEPFWVRRIGPAKKGFSFSTHSLEPRALLALARDLFGAEPECLLLGIRGYEFDEFGEELSEKAQKNLAAAVQYVKSSLESGEFLEV